MNQQRKRRTHGTVDAPILQFYCDLRGDPGLHFCHCWCGKLIHRWIIFRNLSRKSWLVYLDSSRDTSCGHPARKLALVIFAASMVLAILGHSSARFQLFWIQHVQQWKRSTWLEDWSTRCQNVGLPHPRSGKKPCVWLIHFFACSVRHFSTSTGSTGTGNTKNVWFL